MGNGQGQGSPQKVQDWASWNDFHLPVRKRSSMARQMVIGMVIRISQAWTMEIVVNLMRNISIVAKVQWTAIVASMTHRVSPTPRSAPARTAPEALKMIYIEAICSIVFAIGRICCVFSGEEFCRKSRERAFGVRKKSSVKMLP